MGGLGGIEAAKVIAITKMVNMHGRCIVDHRWVMGRINDEHGRGVLDDHLRLCGSAAVDIRFEVFRDTPIIFSRFDWRLLALNAGNLCAASRRWG